MALIECKNVHLSYDNTKVIENLSFSINMGDYVCVLGENGSGKSTLIKAILGLKKPSKGEFIMGDGLTQKQIGYLPQQNNLQKDFPASVYEVVLSGCLTSKGNRLFHSKEQKQLAQTNMKKLDILNLKNRCYRELSGGQQQRVLLARALCATHKMLLLDEPVAGLDPVATAELYELIRKINQELKITIIMVSHDINEALMHSTHVMHVKKDNTFFGDTCDYLNNSDHKNFHGGCCHHV